MTGLGMENERTGTDRTRNYFVYKIYSSTMFRLWMRRAIKKAQEYANARIARTRQNRIATALGNRGGRYGQNSL